MRTTVEITSAQHRGLTALAARRGIRGFSSLVQEAIDRYLEDQRHSEDRAALDLEATLSEEEAEELRRRIEEAWSSWTPR